MLESWGVNGILGLSDAFSDTLLLGLVYRSEADADPEGDRRWRGLRPGVVARLPSEIELGSTNPPGLEAGLRLRASDRARLFFNLGWQDWSRFSNNLLAFGNDRS